jgi:hypothetical protein
VTLRSHFRVVGGLVSGSPVAGVAEAGDSMAALPALFHLMWQHALVADLAVRLTAETLVSVGMAPGGTG